MRQLFRSSLAVAAMLAATLAAPPVVQAESKPTADSVGIAMPHPVVTDSVSVSVETFANVNAVAMIVAGESIAFNLAQFDFSLLNRSVPTLRDALQERSLRPGRLFTDAMTRRDQLRN